MMRGNGLASMVLATVHPSSILRADDEDGDAQYDRFILRMPFLQQAWFLSASPMMPATWLLRSTWSLMF